MDLLDEIKELSESIRTLEDAFLKELSSRKSWIKDARTDIANLIDELIDLDSVLEDIETDTEDDD